jgi:hypothetical protein
MQFPSEMNFLFVGVDDSDLKKGEKSDIRTENGRE